jgi:hypothetical protein
MVALPDGLNELVQMMVENSADVLRKSDGPMLPTVIASDDPPKAAIITVVEAATLEAAVERARRATAALSKVCRAYVLAWDGYLTVGPERSDAILMEAWENTLEQAILLAQRYRRPPFELIGSVVTVDQIR